MRVKTLTALSIFCGYKSLLQHILVESDAQAISPTSLLAIINACPLFIKRVLRNVGNTVAPRR
jgi:hypothetical protein